MAAHTTNRSCLARRDLEALLPAHTAIPGDELGCDTAALRRGALAQASFSGASQSLPSIAWVSSAREVLPDRSWRKQHVW